MIINKNKILFVLITLYPISIIVGPLTSLLNTLFIGLIYLIFFFKDAHYKILYKNKTVKILLLLYIYLIFNILFSLNYEIGLGRSIGFLRLILLFIAINYFFYISKSNIKIFYTWTIIFIIFIADVYFERFLGSNIFGWGAEDLPHGPRIVSFFKDEPIAGSFIHGFIFLISGFLFGFLKDKKKGFYIYFFLISFFLISIFLTGERSNTIKIIFGVVLFVFIADSIKVKSKILILTILFSYAILLISNSSYLKNRYVGQFYYYFSLKDSKKIEDSKYYKLYRSGFNVFKNSPVLGVGNKNYRVESCKDLEKMTKFKYKCTTHPHQVYIEFLAEHGALGTIILLSLFFLLIFKDLKKIIYSKNLIQIGAFIYLVSCFLPLLPSGSFFTDYNITLFFINLSFMYAINKNTNIFFVEKK